jgi:hypothetical protein
MTREELIAKVAELEATLKAAESSQTQLTNELLNTKKQLEDFDKPKINNEIHDEIYKAIEFTIENWDFQDTNLYEFDFGIDYNGKVYVESIEFNEHTYICDEVFDSVIKLFNVERDE